MERSYSAALFPLNFTEREQPNIKIMLNNSFEYPSPLSSSNSELAPILTGH